LAGGASGPPKRCEPSFAGSNDRSLRSMLSSRSSGSCEFSDSGPGVPFAAARRQRRAGRAAAGDRATQRREVVLATPPERRRPHSESGMVDILLRRNTAPKREIERKYARAQLTNATATGSMFDERARRAPPMARAKERSPPPRAAELLTSSACVCVREREPHVPASRRPHRRSAAAGRHLAPPAAHVVLPRRAAPQPSPARSLPARRTARDGLLLARRARRRAAHCVHA